MLRDNPPLDDSRYTLQPVYSAPADYPRSMQPDTSSETPFANRFNARKAAYLEYCLHNPSPNTLRAPFHEIARMAAGAKPHMGFLYAALDYIEQRQDGADLLMHAVLRLLYSNNTRPGLDPEFIERARSVLLGFKYWYSEPGKDAMCTWTESHQFVSAVADYLAGQMFPETRFSNALQTGQQKMAAARPRILRWLDLRFSSGFSAWLSAVTYDECLLALINLIDLCQDRSLIEPARMVTDLLFYDIAINTFKGSLSCTTGIGYCESNTNPELAPISDTTKLMFGTGRFNAHLNLSAPFLALTRNYQLPRVIYDIANDPAPDAVRTFQRMGIRIRETDRWHLDYKNMDDRMAIFGAEAYAHSKAIRYMVDTLNQYGLWQHPFFKDFYKRRKPIDLLNRFHLLGFIANLYRLDISRTYLKEVNTITYRTPDYMLSSAQDFRPGYGASRQHVWQASLGSQAVCFTNHPARKSGSSPNYWNGDGSLPRVAQIDNVLIAIYRLYDGRALHIRNRLMLTHAWLPQDCFDQIEEQAGWVFARHKDAYLAIRPQHPYQWRTAPGRSAPNEILSHGKENIWIVELGRKSDDRSFEDFIQQLSQASISYTPNAVVYHSPSQGQIWFGWEGDLHQNGKARPLDDFPRFDNPYSLTAFDDDTVSIQHGKKSLHLTWSSLTRDASHFI